MRWLIGVRSSNSSVALRTSSSRMRASTGAVTHVDVHPTIEDCRAAGAAWKASQPAASSKDEHSIGTREFVCVPAPAEPNADAF
jgi:hypothetical protein